jgi:hypothetical protein
MSILLTGFALICGVLYLTKPKENTIGYYIKKEPNRPFIDNIISKLMCACSYSQDYIIFKIMTVDIDGKPNRFIGILNNWYKLD